jgi:hypothetical protein
VINQKIQYVHEKVHKFKDVMEKLPPAEVVTTMNENKNLYSEVNELRAEKKAHAKYIEVL